MLRSRFLMSCAGGEMISSTQAIVRLGHGRADDAAHLKRLALFFDQVLVVMPEFWLIKQEVVDDRSRVERLDNGLISVTPGIDPLRDLEPALKVPIGSLGRELDHTLSYLIDRGIAGVCDPANLPGTMDRAEFNELRHQIGWQDAKDQRFAALSGTIDSDYQSRYEPLRFTVYENDRDVPTGQEFLRYAVIPPSAIIDSSDLTTALYAAEATSSSPVFIKPVHHAELAYRYEQYKIGLSVLSEQTGEATPPSRFREQFGSVAFHLGNAVINSQQIERLSIEEVVELRTSMDGARRRFVSEHLVRATNLVEGNPWDDVVKDELERLVQGELSADLMQFQDESRGRYEQLFGSFGAHVVHIAKTTALGSGAGVLGGAAGVTGTVLAAVAPMQMMLIAAIAATIKQAPAVAKGIIEFVRSNQQAQRSSIAYLAALDKRMRR
jgi:hypothetical protein